MNSRGNVPTVACVKVMSIGLWTAVPIAFPVWNSGEKSLLCPSQLTRNTFTPRAEVTKVPYVLIMCFCTVLDQDLAGLLWCVSHHLVLEHWGQSHVPSSFTNKRISGCTQNEQLNVT